MLKQSDQSIPDAGPGSTTLYLQTDAAGIILSASTGLLSFTGKPGKELLGTPLQNLIGAGDKARLQSILSSPVDTGTIIPLALKGQTGMYTLDFTVEYKHTNTGAVLIWSALLPDELMSSTIHNNWFEKFFTLSHEPLCIGGIDGYFKKVNQAFADLLGYSDEELCRQPAFHFIHPDDLQKSVEEIMHLREGRSIREFENRYCCRNGEIKWLQWSTTFLEDDGLVLATVRDITEKKRSEEELRRKTEELNLVHEELNAAIERYHIFVQQSSEIIWRCEWQTPIDIHADEETQYLQLFQGYLAECNDQMAHFYGYTNAAAITGKKVAEFFDGTEPVTRKMVLEFIQQGYKTYRRLSMHVDHQGNQRYFLNNLIGVVKNDRLSRVWTTQTEITEQVKARQSIRESEERFRQFADTAPVMIWVSDEDDNTIYVNRCWQQFTGVEGINLSMNGWKELIHPADRPLAFEKYKRYFKYREPVVLEYRMRHREGDYRWVIDQGVPRFLGDGTFLGYIGSVMDMHDRKQAEESLRISEERYRSVVHALGEGIVIHDKSGQIIACNRSAETLLGIPANVLIGHIASGNSNLCMYEDGAPCPVEQHPSLITLRTGRSLQNAVLGLQRRDGTLLWISMNTEPVYYTQQRVRPDAVVASLVDITQKKAAEMELQRNQQQLTEYSERISNILAGITDGFIAVDKNLQIFLWNHAVERITGMEASQVIGSRIDSIFPNFTGTDEFRQYTDALDRGITANFEHYIPAYSCWLETSVYPFSQGCFVYFRDITERKKQEQLLELEKEVLQINAQPAASLKTTVDCFLEGLEKAYPDTSFSVVVLEDDKKTIRHLSAPRLPVEFASAINGMKIGPCAGSCGTAIWRKEPVITADIITDPLWADIQHLVNGFGLRSCWSFPIIDAQNHVLATIAVYHRYPSTPTKNELNMFQRVSNLLRVIIENKSAEAKIRISNERYLLVTKATNDAIWDWDVRTNSLYWGEGVYSLFGYKPGYVDNSLKFWEANIHEEDHDRVINGLNRFINDSNIQIWEEEYRFKRANGEYALVYDRGFLIFDHAGKITRMVGSMQDITEKKEMERKLLKQEVDKQKLIAQAVVNAQEKERAEIGKELHDNVNQILSTAKLYLELAQTEDEGRVNLIARSADNISDAINEIRSISRSLVPPSVGDLGLIDSVQDLVENVRATKKLHVEFYFEGSVDSLLDEKRKLMLFRIIQEQVNNVLKHSLARNLVIELITDADGRSVDLTITDDGRGFEPDKVRSKKGVGLSNIVSRAQLFNGTVHVITAAGEGCKLKINVPISNM